MCASEVHPIREKTRLVNKSVVIVIPETGFEDDPMRPTILADTVTKKNEKIIIRNATNRLGIIRISVAVQKESTSHRQIPNVIAPPITTSIGRSLSVLSSFFLLFFDILLKPVLNVSSMVGIARTNVIIPPKATAPAPIYLI
jgi:hypothetical protein